MGHKGIRNWLIAAVVMVSSLSLASPAVAAGKVAVAGERGTCGLGDGQGCCGVKGVTR